MKRFKLILPLILLLFLVISFLSYPYEETSSSIKTVPDKVKIGFDSIRPEESYAFLEFIAADELEGRDTASVGQTIARKYIKSLYKVWGIKPAGDQKEENLEYEQTIKMIERKFGPEMRIEVFSGNTHASFFFEKDFNGGTGADIPGVIDAPVVFAGYGLSAPDLGYDDFSGINVSDKIVIISTGKPGDKREDSPFNFPENLARFAGWRTPAENCARLLAKKGAVALLLVDESLGEVDNAGGYKKGTHIDSDRRKITALKLSTVDRMIPFFWVSLDVAASIFSTSGKTFPIVKKMVDSSLKPRSFDIKGARVKISLDIERINTVSANLLGMVEGTDPQLKKEYIIIGAHLDHVGMNKDGYVFNGADDNGSGSVGVLQIAKAFALNPTKPKRSVIFAHWTGEEKGLLGSTHFVYFPTVPFKNIVACINLDMICTNTAMEDLKKDIDEYSLTKEKLARYDDDPETLMAAITSLPSPDIVSYYTQLSRDYLALQPVPLCSYPMPGNSDHYSFAQKKVPSVFFFTMGDGLAHQPADTAERINAEKMSKIVKLAYLLAFKIADTPERPVWESDKQ